MLGTSSHAMDLLDELVMMERKNPLAAVVNNLGRTQQEVYEDDAKWRLLRAPNKTGKSSTLSIEAWLALLRQHRRLDLPTNRPPTLIYGCPDLGGSYADDVCVSLREYEPPGMLHPGCTYTPSRGYYIGGRRGLMLHDGAKIIFRSGHQSQKGQAGIYGDMLLINEPPEEAQWGELVRSAALWNAPILMAFTAIGDLAWLRAYIEADDSEWSQHLGKLTINDCPWRTQASIDAQIKLCPEGEREQRIYGGWDAPSLSRLYTGYSDNVVSDRLPRGDVNVILGLDHGTAPGHEAIVIGAAWRDRVGAPPRVHILSEYTSPGRTTVVTDAQAIVRMLAEFGFTTKDILIAVGDVGTAGKSSLISLNREFEEALRALTGWSPGIRTAKKRKGSPEYEAHLVDTAMIDRMFHVHPDCVQLIEAYKRWQGTRVGKDSDHSHILDATRYVSSPIFGGTEARAAMISVG